MRNILTKLVAVTALLLSASAQAVLIDFEDETMIGDGLLSPGDIITNVNLFGATFMLTTPSGDRELMLFNSNCGGMLTSCTGGDPDLSTTTVPMGVEPISAGNILIISEDNDSMDPDDSAAGGSIIIKFDTDVTSITGVTVDVGDTDVGPNSFEAFLDGESVETMLLTQGLGENNVQSRTFTGLFDEIRLNLAGSGALASLEFTPVPLPAALPLFMAGLLALFGMRRKAIV